MKLLCLILFSFCFLNSAVLAQTNPNRYDQVMGQVRDLADSPYVRLLDPGQSTDSRAIPALIITDFHTPSGSKARVFVCAGQHGDEINPINSLLSLCRSLADGKHSELLSGCIFIVVPVVNPGGLVARQRLSSDNTDINRDWVNLSTPEVWFVDSIIRQWNPHILIDLHEWMEPIKGAANCIEVSHIASKKQKLAMSSAAERVAGNSGLSVIYCGNDSNPALFHRRYTSLGYAAYLIETAYGESYASKERNYHSAVISLSCCALQKSQSRAALSPASGKFDMAVVSAQLQPPRRLLSASTLPYLSVLLGLGYCLMLWLMKLNGGRDEAKWDRKLTRCLVENGVDTSSLRSRRSPQPLTSKSWVNRRLRSRYSNTRRRASDNAAAHASTE